MVLTKRQNATRRISSSTTNADSVATSSRANNNMATTVSEEKVCGSHHNDMMMDIDDDATEDLSNEDNNRDAVISSRHLDSRTTTTIMAPFGEQENNKNTDTNSVWANATTTRSFGKIISEEEMELKLKQDIRCLKQEVYNAVQMAVVTSVDDPNFDNIWAREFKLKDKLNKATETYKSMFGCDPIAEGKIFDQNKHKYKTPDDCVSDFENIPCAHKRPIGTYWKDYIITILPGPILAWYDTHTLKWCLTDPLPADLFKDVEKDFRDKDLIPEETVDILAFHQTIYKKSQEKRNSFSKKNNHDRDSRRYENSKSHHNSHRIHKKKHCIIHPTSADHDTKDCRTRAACIKKGICFHCFKTWNPSHQCKNSKNKDNNSKRPLKRNKKKGDASPKNNIVPMEVDESSSYDSCDTDNDSNLLFAAAKLDKPKQDCKFKTKIDTQYFQTPPEGLITDNSIYLPVTIEHVRCWALCDPGANFSCISPTLCQFLKLKNTLNKHGLITLISDDKIERDVTWDDENHNPIIPIIEPYSYTPNEDPYFSPIEQEYLLKEIEPYIVANKNIPKSAYYTIPGSEIKLPLKKDAQSAYRRQYQINECHVQAVKDQVQKWIELGIVERAPPNIPYNSPLLTVPKKDPKTGEYDNKNIRCVVDSRLVNNNLDKRRIDRFPLPLISDLHRIMSRYILFTTIDLSQCFHSFRIRKSDRPLTAFTTPDGVQLQFQRAPFGLTPISSVVQRSLTSLFADLDYVVNFIDDIYILSDNNFEKHKQHVQTVLERLTLHNLRINTDKLHVAQKSIYVLGFCLNEKGLTLDQRKVANVLDWPDDVNNSKELSHRLGVMNYFRDHIPNISQLTAPLNQLKNHPNLKAVWTNEHSKAIRKLKEALVNAPVISVPSLKYSFHLVTDAYDYGISGCLYQVINNEIKYIVFVARTLSPTERRYGSTRRELLAVVYSFTKWRKWLYGKHFHLFVDNKALLEINRKETKIANRAIESYYETIFEMEFDITYCAGMRNILADKLSRLFYPDVENTLARDEAYAGKENGNEVKGNKNKEKSIRQAVSNTSQSDTKKQKARAFHDLEIDDDNISPDSEHEEKESLVLAASHLDNYKIIDNLDERQKLIENVHALGHYGVNQTELKIKQDHGFYWKGLREDITKYINECPKCSRHNLAKHAYHPPKSICPNGIWDQIAIDLGSFDITSTNGNNFLLVIVDLFSRFVVLRAIKTKSALDVALALVQVFSMFGYSKCLIHDNGLEFKNKLLKAIKDHMGVEESLSLPYTPTGNSVAEASVGSAKRIIIKMLEGYNEAWDMYVDGTAYAMNQHISRLHGLKPFEAMFNRKVNDLKDYTKSMRQIEFNEETINVEKLKTAIEKFNNTTLPEVREQILETQRKDNEYFVKKHRILNNPFPIGSTVMIKNIEGKKSKTDSKYIGPFTVHNHTKNGNYVLTDLTGSLFDRNVPTSQIKLVSNDTNKTNDNKDIYEVQAIINHREIAPSKFEYLTSWVGYPGEQTWQKQSTFQGTDAIKKYWERRKADGKHAFKTANSSIKRKSLFGNEQSTKGRKRTRASKK
ncbi:hypothetical protein RO3G_07123 [Rhizopus delemar RA 99-880]|uniref:Reverse transcriptase n=1 Tax=Rhizopus delemar (strain RA 99-880 / ATCC MYA-4621 / FGSC 9543 / NRRL 43880) TaxID=246409 RepID=I1C1T8_RHIO9|nr:hypothetical protein RO3G_07123 [Rhizopus delemar RA 99-880]|eukprot:EIE82418.1 hypothetical protein RO3G_07123 [Rhizopus delemar RA 99-880]